MVRTPAVITEIGDFLHRSRRAARRGRPRRAARRGELRAIPARWPESTAGRRARQLRRVAGWTGAWTLFQWWAVIGWPSALGGGGVLVGTAALSAIGLVVWLDVRRPMRVTARPAAVGHHPPAPPEEDLAA